MGETITADIHAGQKSDRDAGSTASDRFSATLCRTIVRATPDCILLVDAAGLIREVNERTEELFGYTREELVGQPVEILVPQSVRHKHVHERSEYTAHPRQRLMASTLDLVGCRKDGTEFPVEISLSPLAGDDEKLVIAMVRNITDRRQLRELGRSTLQAAERERQRIAHELHDDTAQRLATVILRLQAAARQPGATPELDEIREDVREAADGLRRLARGLRPPALEDAGVAAAIRAHTTRTLDRSVKVTFDLSDVDQRLDENGRLVLYRVLQEATTNVARHAGASSVHVAISAAGDRITGLVRDDGVGFDADGALRSIGRLGLLGMRERARSVLGTVTIKSAEGSGTEVSIDLPAIAEPSA